MVPLLFALGLLSTVLPIVTVTSRVDCPGTRTIEDALDQLLGTASRVPPRWTLNLEPGAAAQSQTEVPLRLTLRASRGEEVFVRVIRASTENCQAVADAAAMMVEGYFRGVAWTAGTPPPMSSSVGRPQLRASSAELPRTTADARRPARLQLSAGAGAWSRGASSFGFLEVRGRVAGPVSVATAAWVPSFGGSEHPADGGEVRLKGWPLLLRTAAERERGRFSWRGGLDGVVTFEQGKPLLGFTNAETRNRIVFALGGTTGVALALSHRWRLTLEAAGYRTLAGHSFTIDDAVHGTRRVLEPPAWQGIVALGLGWVLLP